MNPVRTLQTQCTQAQFLRRLPSACGYRHFELSDNEVRVHDSGREIRIQLHHESVCIRGSLDSSMEAVHFEFVGFDEAAADQFMREYGLRSIHTGGAKNRVHGG